VDTRGIHHPRRLPIGNVVFHPRYRLMKSPVTGETILEITDYTDEDEVEATRQLWEAQMEQLRRATGG
ncbi:MAG: hypothetical protein AAFV80_09005, partial [Bacteroidota bacterium]